MVQDFKQPPIQLRISENAPNATIEPRAGAGKGRKVRPVVAMYNYAKKRGVKVLKCGQDYIEVTCGCSCITHGDTGGKLKIYTTGQFLITCLCNMDHTEGKMTPAEFEKHSMLVAQNWKETVWVYFEHTKYLKRRKIGNEERTKIPLKQSGLLKYYKHGSNMPSRGLVRRRWNFHRDEFIRCSRCSKIRRFRLRTKDECRIYHDALHSKRWKCRDRPYDTVTCEDDEERESRRRSRGCPRASSECKGCSYCTCPGCLKCCFMNCTCRTCVDFMQNAAA